MNYNKLAWAGAALCALLPFSAWATNGYFQHGYGVKSQGMAGVGIALPQDAIAAATNPAGMAFIGDRLDIGAVWFRPMRGADISGNNPFLPAGAYEANETNNFILPEFGYNKMINPSLALGVSVYGNGGMNTDYSRPIPLFNGGTANTSGVDLAQLFIAPTVAYKINPNHSIGLSLNLVYQRFAAKGLQGFAGFSSNPAALTDKGHDSSTGWGFHIGWTGKVTDSVTLGATYQSKTWMGKFNDYAGLFADQGAFDIPASYGVGIAVNATPAVTLAFDVQRILYSDVPSVGNRSTALLLQGVPLGASNGVGFGWQDMTVYKLGAAWAYSPTLTFRAGVSHGSQPIESQDVLINILAPGVPETHGTLGLTWAVNKTSELSFSYMHAFKHDVSGAVPAAFGGGTVNLRMYQDSLGVAYSWKF